MFSILRDHPTIFQSGFTILHSHQLYMRVPDFSTSSPTLAVGVFDHSHPSGYEVVSQCRCSLMTNDASIFSCVYSPYACLWRNAYSDPLSHHGIRLYRSNNSWHPYIFHYFLGNMGKFGLCEISNSQRRHFLLIWNSESDETCLSVPTDFVLVFLFRESITPWEFSVPTLWPWSILTPIVLELKPRYCSPCGNHSIARF